MIYEIDESLTPQESLVIDQTMANIVPLLNLKESVYVTFTRSENETGGCIDIEDDEYIVEIPHTNEVELFVAHEMKHVEQYNSGRLQQGNMWMGKCYDDTPYMCKPWEIEAYFFEKNTKKM